MRSIERSHGNPKHVLNEIPLAILPPDAHFNPPLKFSFKFGGRRRKGLKGHITKGRRLLARGTRMRMRLEIGKKFAKIWE